MDFRNIHNYYEYLVFEYMRGKSPEEAGEVDSDFTLDVACYALNKLPARYLRHEIDMAFYLTSQEREQMDAAVKKAVEDAFVFIRKNFNKDDRYDVSSSTNSDQGNQE